MLKDVKINPQNTEESWNLIGLIILSIRFVQGWIFWGGGSRRFVYAPQKLDPYSSQWLANKLQSAMPGALLGVGEMISYLLQHFFLLYVAIILFSLAELLAGAALIAGFFTRTASAITAFISIMLMLIFGWQGSTCIDEWTMAVASFSMALTLMLSGSPIYSVDSLLMRRYPQLSQRRWFLIAGSGPLSFKKLKIWSILFFIVTVFFTLTTYNYYRGAIFSRYHGGPVSPIIHHVSLTNGRLAANGTVTFNAYIDAGSPSLPSHIIRIELVNTQNKIIEEWQSENLSALPKANIINEYDYNRIENGPYGLIAPVGAKASIVLPPTTLNNQLDLADKYQLIIFTISGHRFNLELIANNQLKTS